MVWFSRKDLPEVLTIMKLIIVLIILLSLVNSQPTLAYEVYTHEHISEAALKASDLTLEPKLLSHIGLKPSSDETQKFIDRFFQPKTMLELIQYGAEQEDDAYGSRFLHHFYDPLPSHAPALAVSDPRIFVSTLFFGPVLSRFGKTRAEARRVYRQYMEEGSTQGRKPELVGGGLLRSRGGWAEVVAMRKHEDKAFTDERVLGSGEFVATLLQEADKHVRERWVARLSPQTLATYVEHACDSAGVSAQALSNGGRGREVSQLHMLLAHQLVKEQGLSLAETARHLGVTTSAICKALRKEVR